MVSMKTTIIRITRRFKNIIVKAISYFIRANQLPSNSKLNNGRSKKWGNDIWKIIICRPRLEIIVQPKLKCDHAITQSVFLQMLNKAIMYSSGSFSCLPCTFYFESISYFYYYLAIFFFRIVPAKNVNRCNAFLR